MEPSLLFPTLDDFWTTTTSTLHTSNPSKFLTPIWNATEDVLNTTNATVAAPVSRAHKQVLAIMLSIAALSFSIAVYATLAEFRNLHGRILICISSCLLTTYVLFSVDLAVGRRMTRALCFTVGMIIQVSFLGTFFWTNVMAFDIWRSLTATRGSSGELRFRRYAAYAWTATAATALPAALLELTPWVPHRYRPQLGVKRCWLNGLFAFLHYFNIPVGFILLANLLLILLTLRRLRIIKRTTAELNVRQQQKRFCLFTKLFFVMSITWTSEHLPWMTGKKSLYAMTAMLTAFQGCFLFFIYVCRKRILKLFYDRVIEFLPSQYNSAQQTSSSSDSNKKNIDLNVIELDSF